MAIDYVTSNTGLFYRLGKMIKVVNRMATEVASTINTDKQDVIDPFEAADLDEQITGVSELFESFKSNRIGQRQQVAALGDRVWDERVTSLNQLGLLNYNPATYFPALFRQMVTDSASVDQQTVSIGSVTAGSGNIGNGTILITKRLDGFNVPVANGVAVPWYASSAVDSELAANETMRFTCVEDGDRGADDGSETFAWQGAISHPDGQFGDFEGSGQGPSLTVTGDSSLLENSTMEEFSDTANLPDGWTKASGTVGTHILQDTSNYYRGTSALKFKGDGAQATIQITQAIDPGDVNPYRMYCLTARVKCSNNAPAAGDLEIALTGTGWSVPSTDKISVGHAALTTSWALKSCFILLPLTIPSDLYAYIKVTGTLTNTVEIYIDDVILTEVTYHGGLGSVAVPGSTPFAYGDYFTSAITNNAAGTFQEYMRKQYGVQLPSNGAGSETIDDALAA